MVTVVFAGAPLQVTPRLSQRLAALTDPYVIAADSGAATALAFGFTPDIVIGDMDSLGDATREQLQGVPFDTFPRAKDATDSELALSHAMRTRQDDLLLLGFLNGPRLDMTLANVLLLRHAPPNTVLLDERNEARLLRSGQAHTWHPEPEELLSLLPLNGDCEGVRTSGLLYPLHAERLEFGRARGVSNEPDAHTASVSVESGLLLLIRHFARL